MFLLLLTTPACLACSNHATWGLPFSRTLYQRTNLHGVEPEELSSALREELELRLEVVAVVHEAQRAADHPGDLAKFV